MAATRSVVAASIAARLAAALGGAVLVMRGAAPLLVRRDPTSAVEFQPAHLALIVLGALLVLLAVSWRRAASAYRTVGVIALNSVVLLAIVELAASHAVRDQQPGGPAPPRDLFGRGRDSASIDTLTRDTIPVESGLPYYRSQTWAAQHWRELRATKADYKPYVLWRRAPFRGRTITVDSLGYRVTPGSDCQPGRYTVFVLGGSTVWGYGVPDWATLPAYLAQEIRARRSAPVCVRNLGELGFNSTQDLIELMHQLQAGQVPNLVLVYQGINDVWTAAQNGRPGLHFYLREIAGRLEGGPGKSLGGGWFTHSGLVRWLSRYALHQDAPGGERLPGYLAKHWVAPDTLGADVVRLWLANAAMVDALARAYGFGYEMYWQPNLLAGQKPATREEREFRDREASEGDDWVKLMARSYALVAQEAPRHPHVHDMANVFARDSAVLYSDWAHLNPDGNRRIARLIVAGLGDLTDARPVAASKAPRPGGRAAGGDQ